MEEITVASSIAAESVDFSMLSLFLRADFVVKSVIIILILASLYSWTIIVAKLIRIKQLKKLEKEFTKELEKAFSDYRSGYLGNIIADKSQ